MFWSKFKNVNKKNIYRFLKFLMLKLQHSLDSGFFKIVGGLEIERFDFKANLKNF